MFSLLVKLVIAYLVISITNSVCNSLNADAHATVETIVFDDANTELYLGDAEVYKELKHDELKENNETSNVMNNKEKWKEDLKNHVEIIMKQLEKFWGTSISILHHIVCSYITSSDSYKYITKLMKDTMFGCEVIITMIKILGLQKKMG